MLHIGINRSRKERDSLNPFFWRVLDKEGDASTHHMQTEWWWKAEYCSMLGNWSQQPPEGEHTPIFHHRMVDVAPRFESEAPGE